MMYLTRAADMLYPFFMTVSFALGAVLGSFANVCISRWPQGLSVVKPASRCPQCGNAIAWYDNLPVLSWLMLRAKCRHCSLPISWQYPLVELITAFLFLAVYWRFGFTLASPVYMALAFAMVVCTFQDFADWTIPDEITLPGIPAGLVISAIGMYFAEVTGLRVLNVFDAAAGVVLGAFIPFAIDRITVLLLKKPGMGMGDVKLLAMLGAFIGWQGVLGSFLMACFMGSIVGMLVIGYYKVFPSPERPETAEPAGEDEEDDGIHLDAHYLPFGPYLAISGLIWVFAGPELLEWYLAFLTYTPSVQLESL